MQMTGKFQYCYITPTPALENQTPCKCNPVIIPARTRIAPVEEIQAIQNIGTRETERSTGEDRLPPHLIDVLDAASGLTSVQPICWLNISARFQPLGPR